MKTKLLRAPNYDLGMFYPQPPCLVTPFAIGAKDRLKCVHRRSVCAISDGMDVDLEPSIEPLPK